MDDFRPFFRTRTAESVYSLIKMHFWRVVALTSAILALAIVVHWYYQGASIPTGQLKHPFTPAWMLFNEFDEDPRWLVALVMHTTALLVLLCAGAAVLLLRSRMFSLVKNLALTFGVGSLCLSLFGFVTPIWEVQFPQSLFLNSAAVTAFLYALYLWPKFFRVYPTTLDSTDIARSLEERDQRLAAKYRWIKASSHGFYTQAHSSSIYDLLDSPRLFVLLLTNGLLLAVLWETGPALAAFGLFLFAPFATFLSAWNAYHKLHANFLLSKGDDRERIRWIQGAAWIALLIITTSLFLRHILERFVFQSSGSEMSSLLIFMAPQVAAIIVVLGFLVSVFYRGDIDPALAVSKSATYSIIALVFTAGFVAVEAILESQIIIRLGLPSGNYSAIISALITTAIVEPIRRRVEPLVDTVVKRGMPKE